MPDRDRALRWLSRVLPREFRERVFEPALADLRLDEAESRAGRWARLALAAECLRVGLPQYFWRRRRPTRITLALGLAAIVVAFAVARLRYAASRADAWQSESR